MQYHSHDRPRGPNGLPLYHTPGGWLATLPQLSVAPANDGSWRISVMLLIRPNEAQWFTHNTFDLGPLLDDWGADPEGTMTAAFQWKWRGGDPGQQPIKTTLTLDDLMGE